MASPRPLGSMWLLRNEATWGTDAYTCLKLGKWGIHTKHPSSDSVTQKPSHFLTSVYLWDFFPPTSSIPQRINIRSIIGRGRLIDRCRFDSSISCGMMMAFEGLRIKDYLAGGGACLEKVSCQLPVIYQTEKQGVKASFCKEKPNLKNQYHNIGTHKSSFISLFGLDSNLCFFYN